MAKEKTLFRVENERSPHLYFGPIDGPTDRIFGYLFRSADRLADPVLFPFLITIYEAPNARSLAFPHSVTPKIIIDYYPLAFGGNARDELFFFGWIEGRPGSLYRMDGP